MLGAVCADLVTSGPLNLIVREEKGPGPCLRAPSLGRQRMKFPKSTLRLLPHFSGRVWQALQDEREPQGPWGHLDHQGQR